jgi:serine protease Do
MQYNSNKIFYNKVNLMDLKRSETMRQLMKLSVILSLLFLVGCASFGQTPEVLVTFTGEFNEVISDTRTELGRPVDLPEVTQENAVFLGWFDADNPRYQVTPFTPLFKDVTLIARFEAIPVMITFERFDEGFTAPLQINIGHSVSELPVPRRANYSFAGWYLDENLTIPVRLPLGFEQDTTLYASWVFDVTGNLSILEYEQSIINMIEQVRTSVLGISNIRNGLPGSSGSGVIYRREGNTYYVVTNHHVLNDFEELEIIFERNDLIFTITDGAIEFIGSDATTDIGVLKFTSALDFAVAEFADYYSLQLGQYVYAVGSPLGFTYFNSVTQGIISGLSRFFENSAGLGAFAGFVIQHDAAINPGNSGGALFTSQGEFVGINTFKIDASPTGRNLEGLGFSVPSNTIIRVVADLEENGRVIRPFFGISSQVLVASCGQDFGVCVQAVVADSSASRLGIEVGDVIIGFQNDSMSEMLRTNNFNQLREAILNSRVGQNARVELIRDGETIITDYEPLVTHPDDRE